MDDVVCWAAILSIIAAMCVWSLVALLSGYIHYEPQSEPRAASTRTRAVVAPEFDSLDLEVMSALRNLGCSRVSAEQAVLRVKQSGAPANFEAYFRAALTQAR